MQPASAPARRTVTGLLLAMTLGLSACGSSTGQQSGATASTGVSPSASTVASSGASATNGHLLPARGRFPGDVVRDFESNSPQGWSATFQVLKSPKGNLLVDPGSYDKQVADYVKGIGGVKAILITHGHWDKLRGLDAALKANPGATVYVHRLDKPYFTDMTRNTSIEDGSNGTTHAPATTIDEGMYTIAGHRIHVIHLPGHTEGSVLYHLVDENIMFAGDTIMPTLVGSANHPGGNAEDRAASIARFKTMSFPSDMMIYNGHYHEATYAEVLRENADLH